MIGRVGVLGNLGEGKSIDNPGPDPKGISWHGHFYQGQGRTTKPEVSGLGCEVCETAQRGCKLSEGVPEHIFGIDQPKGNRGAER